jgi:hypothetical protein
MNDESQETDGIPTIPDLQPLSVMTIFDSEPDIRNSPIQLSRYGGEKTFRAPFPVVNAAVYEWLSYISGGHPRHPENTPGATSYIIRFKVNDTIKYFRAYVLQRGTELTTFRIQGYLPSDPHQWWEPIADDRATAERFGYFFMGCTFAILKAMRYERPTLTYEQLTDVVPPMPTLDEGWNNVFLWHGMYAKQMSDKDLAARLGVSYGTLRNERSKRSKLQTLGKRANEQAAKIPRGKPKTDDKK